ncbi:hypothetical protein QFZ71_005216 [Streptomyces sp. V2I9]|nr:hypothetical protein [Streptomyces sp. V2I9]
MTSITYTAVLDVGRETAETLARLLHEHRERLGTRKGNRALGEYKQGVLVLRWLVDGTGLAQLACDNAISVPTVYRCLYEGLAVLADHAPDLSTALERAAAAGYTPPPERRSRTVTRRYREGLTMNRPGPSVPRSPAKGRAGAFREGLARTLPTDESSQT